MAERGWYVNRNVHPRGIQLMLSPGHAPVMDDLLADLTAAVAAVSGRPRGDSAGEDPPRYS
jgi:hypothetical protein